MLFKFLLTILLFLARGIGATSDAAMATFATTSAVLIFVTVVEAIPISLTAMPDSAVTNNSYHNSTSPPLVVATVQTIDQPTTTRLTTTLTGFNATKNTTATNIDRLSPIQEGDNPPRKGVVRSTIVAVVVCLSLFLLFLGAIHHWAKYYRPTNFSTIDSTNIVVTTRPGTQAIFVALSGRKQ